MKLLPRHSSYLSRHPILAWCILVFVCFLPVLVMRDFSASNELRYINIVDEAISNGHFFAFTLQGEPYADKPPFYFWMLMLPRYLFGSHIMFFMSLISLLPAFGVIAIMDRWVRSELRMGVQERVFLAAILTISMMFIGPALVVRMDMLMTLFIVLALYTFYRMYKGEGNFAGQRYLLPLWVFLGLFTKGLVGLVVPPIAILCFLLWKKEGRSVGRYLGWRFWLVLGGLFALWIIGAYFEGGASYINNLLFHQTVDRAVKSFAHNRPFWFYLVAIWTAAAPYCLLLVPLFVVGCLRRTTPRASDIEVLFSIVVLSLFVELSSFSGKLPVYLLPLIPFMVYCVPFMTRRLGWSKWMEWALVVVPIILVVVCTAALVGLLLLRNTSLMAPLLDQFPFLCDGLVIGALVALLLGCCLALWVHFSQGNFRKSVIYTVVSIAVLVYIAGFDLPEINSWMGYGNLCRSIPPEASVATIYMHRPENMDYYLGREIQDYGKDPDAYLSDYREGKAPDVLVVKISRLSHSAALEEMVENWEGLSRRVGPFLVLISLD